MWWKQSTARVPEPLSRAHPVTTIHLTNPWLKNNRFPAWKPSTTCGHNSAWLVTGRFKHRISGILHACQCQFFWAPCLCLYCCTLFQSLCNVRLLLGLAWVKTGFEQDQVHDLRPFGIHDATYKWSFSQDGVEVPESTVPAARVCTTWYLPALPMVTHQSYSEFVFCDDLRDNVFSLR